MATECEWKAYSPLASATIVYHQSVVSVGFSLTSISPQYICATSSTSFATNNTLALLHSSDTMDQIIPKIGADTIGGSSTTESKVEDAEMTEKPPNHDVEQADSDLTVTMSNHRPLTLLEKLASLPSSASLSESGKLCPTSPQTRLILIVAPMLGLMFGTEKIPQMQRIVATPLSAVISTFSDRVETDDSLLTDTEESRPTTGVTTVFEQTEATSPAISTPGDQVALSWRPRMSQLGSGGSASVGYLFDLTNGDRRPFSFLFTSQAKHQGH